MRAYGNNVYNGSVTTNTNPNSYCNPLYAWLPVSRQSCSSCVSPVCLELDQLVFTAGCFVPQYDYAAWFSQIPVNTSQINSGPVPIYPLDSSLVGVGTKGAKPESPGGATTLRNHMSMDRIPRIGMSTNGCSNYHCDGTNTTHPNSFGNPLYKWLPVEWQRNGLNVRVVMPKEVVFNS